MLVLSVAAFLVTPPSCVKIQVKQIDLYWIASAAILALSTKNKRR